MTIGFISGENRNITISVNGGIVQTVNANSGGWGTVGTTTVTIQLAKGNNTVKLSNASSWMPDIDYIDVTPIGQTGIDEVKAATAKDQQFYDLQGRKVKDGQAHGIVISNNRKVIIRK